MAVYIWSEALFYRSCYRSRFCSFHIRRHGYYQNSRKQSDNHLIRKEVVHCIVPLPRTSIHPEIWPIREEREPQRHRGGRRFLTAKNAENTKGARPARLLAWDAS